MVLDARIAADLQKNLDSALKSGDVLTIERLDECFNTFKQHFGPEVLAGLDGEALLETMHAHGRKDSLVYWLEFKDDDELPARFGSIAGGSALKFGIYRSNETGLWMAGPPLKQQTLSKEEAIDIARRHRDQLLRGCELIGALPQNAGEADYEQLQQDLEREAPEVAESAWGHKYFHMIFPKKLDDFHCLDYQRFHLIKMLQEPPEGPGRYRAAFRYNVIAHELGWPLNHLTSALNRRDGAPYRYWRVGTKIGGTDSVWDEMRTGNFIAIGFPEISNLSWLKHTNSAKEELRKQMETHYPTSAQMIGRKTQELFNFATSFRACDLAIAMDGGRVLGIGRITGDYYYEPSKCPHRRPVEWLRLDEWSLPEMEGKLTTIHQIAKHNKNLIEIEKRIVPTPPPPPLVGQIERILERKKQVILYGPPGTGKTYWAEKAAHELAARRNGSDGDGFVRMCAFHPNYGYEDFIEGYRPIEKDGRLAFELRDGIFKAMCGEAAAHPDRHYYLIIDEINRGDIPRIFGELLTLLEADKRGKVFHLPISGDAFHVPANLYVIGTMNTADRSIALLDTALRRRFGFIELLPDPNVLGDVVLEGVPVGAWLKALNERIVGALGPEGRNLRIGHSYFMPEGDTVSSFSQFARVIREEVIPLLEEYCYEDFGLMEQILGKNLIDSAKLRIKEELFNQSAPAALASALLAASPELATSGEAIEGEAEAAEDAGEHEEDTSDELETADA